MNHGTLICVTGLDGAGKSTLTKRVVSELQLDGYDATRTYGRYLPKLTYPMMELGRRTLLSNSKMEEDYNSHQSSKNDLFSNPLLSRGYEAAIMADYLPQLLNRVVRPLYQHDIVVCDRFFYDTLLTDLAGDVIKSPEEAIDRYRRYSKLLPEPDYEFYLQVQPEISMERKDDIPSLSFLKDRKHFYDSFASERGIITLDGTQPIEVLQDQVIDSVTSGIHEE